MRYFNIALLASLACGLGSCGGDASPQPVPKAVISLDLSVNAGTVNPLLFGANDRAMAAASGGADPTTGFTYPGFESQMRAVGLKLIRFPGGTAGGTYQWQNAIGPQAARQPQIIGVNSPPTDSVYGPDEFGARLLNVGAQGTLMLNYATETAQNAANFVQYMTGTVNSDPNNQANTRAANGHASPYPIAFAELGNEPYVSSQRYWREGTFVSSKRPCTASAVVCLYAYGGTTAFTGQRLSKPSDYRDTAGISSGTANQRFVMRYAPIVATSAKVYVNGVAWTQVSDLSAVGATTSYALNATTGAVTFGDGVHGAIPPDGAVLTADYQSGPHDGFVDFYTAIKAVNPSLPVCTSYNTEEFFTLMGAAQKYDCAVVHTYGHPSDPSLSDDAYATQLLATPADQLARVQWTRSQIDAHAGGHAASIGILLSEYGTASQLGLRYPHEGRLLINGVLAAQNLLNWISTQTASHLIGAARHVLINYTLTPPPSGLYGDGSDGVMFAGPGPNTVPEPPALAMQLLSPLAGQVIRGTSVGTADLLSTLLTQDAATGNLELIVINQDISNATAATVNVGQFAHSATALVQTLNSANYTDTNTLEAPNTVSISQSTAQVGAGASFVYTFPAHSVTAIKLVAM